MDFFDVLFCRYMVVKRLDKIIDGNNINHWDALTLIGICALCQPFMDELKLHVWHTPFYTYLTAHLVHINWTHFTLNMACATCICFLLPNISRKLFWFAVVFISLGISTIMVVFNQLETARLSSYVGFSGTLHGLYVLFAGMMMAQTILAKQQKRYFFWQSALLFFGTFVKIAYDALVKPEHTAKLIDAPVAFVAHVDGAVLGIGLLTVYVILFWIKYIQTVASNKQIAPD